MSMRIRFNKVQNVLAVASLLVSSLLGLASPVAAQTSPAVYINEIQVSTTSTDWEFFELQGEPGTDLSALTLIGVESDVDASTGTIDRVISLAGQAIPADGFWLGISPAGASTYGVTGELSIPDNSFENSTATYFLVSGFTGEAGDDLDTDDDGVLDSPPWAEVLDAINIRDAGAGDFDYGVTSVGPDGSYLPSGTYRCPDAPEGTFGGFHNFSAPDGTPGEANSQCPAPEVYINEIQVSTTSTDWEFFELQGDAGTYLSNLTLVGVESDADSAAGTVDLVVSLAGQAIPADGFWLGINPAGASAYEVTGELSIADNSFENSTATYFLVSNFEGSQGDDLDTDDDGVLDVTPWSEILDAINIRDADAGDFDYGATSVGPDGYYLPSGTYRCPDAPDGMFGNIHNFSTPDGTPGEANDCIGECGDPATLISAVQGDGAASPLVGKKVVIEGIVVGDFQWGGNDSGDLGGFYVQEEDSDADLNPDTSEGVFVYDGSFGVDVAVGDRVRVYGVVSEYFDLTEIGSLSGVLLCDSGNSITPASVSLPVASVDDLERYEGMSVLFSQPLYISEFYNFDRYGEIVLTTERQFQPTAVYEPGSPEAAQLAIDNQLSRIQLEDGRTSENPDPALHPNGGIFDLTNRFRGGDIVQNVTGVMDYDYGAYQIQPTAGADYTAVNERPDVPDVGGNIKAASFNVLNYFTTLDDGTNDICGPDGLQECRGADNETEFERQQAKIVAALCAIDADVFGLMELENTNPDNDPDPYDGISNYVLKSLVDALNAEDSPCAGETYAFTDGPATGTDAIQQGIIYKPSTVTPLGRAVLDDPSFTDPLGYGDQQTRPAVAQTFMDNATGGVFTVVVNHLKSKSCYDYAKEGDLDLGDGQACFNETRALGAQVLADWLASDPTDSGDGDVLILGDLNSYDKEDPIDVLVANGHTDLVFKYGGEYAYSYVFDGQLGYLDYGMANEDLLPEVTGTAAWHINADEPDILDYDTSYKKDAQDALYEPNAYRSSDHDPVIVGLDVCDEIAPTLEVSVSPEMLWPPNHKYVDVLATVVVLDNFDPSPTLELVSVTSNEPDNGLGDGDTPEDIVIIDDFTFLLRAERAGTGEDRVYTITYQAIDACGNSTMVSVTVTVPHDKGKDK
jgi:predicted extracellular nuclease